jgi:hypothetical protein
MSDRSLAPCARERVLAHDPRYALCDGHDLELASRRSRDLVPSRAQSDQHAIRIANRATYWPVAPIDLLVGAPMLARLLLGGTLPGRIVQAAALGAYLDSVVRDWRARRGVRKIDFRREFGTDPRRITPMPETRRDEEIVRLVERLNDLYTPTRLTRRELAVEIDRHLTDYIAGITGQRVETSAEVRSFSLAQVLFPFALGACDVLTGDVAVFRDTGVFEPHIIAHEFSHRKGYWKELEAQVLAYLALAASGEPVLVQSALAERLHRHLTVRAGEEVAAYRARVMQLGLRSELMRQFLALRPPSSRAARAVGQTLRRLYDERMRLTGQNGLSDYDVGFTSVLYTFETTSTGRQRPPAAGALWPRGMPPDVLPASPTAAGTGLADRPTIATGGTDDRETESRRARG